MKNDLYNRSTLFFDRFSNISYPNKAKSIVGKYYRNDYCSLDIQGGNRKNTIQLYTHGSVEVAVHVDDFGISVKREDYTKEHGFSDVCNVYGFTVINNL